VKFVHVIFALLILAFAVEARAEKRVALVIGNSSYQHVPRLANPANDAADMASKLESLGFDVVSGHDLDLAGVRQTIRDFIARLDGADMALFYYAGHGLQVNGENYLAPVDAKLSSYIDLDFEAVPMNLIMSAMERSTKINLFFFDACRDNPLLENLSRSMGTRSGSVGRGLAKLGTGIGSLIAFATQPGNVALDGNGRNSPFTAALLRHLGTPGEDITRDLVKVRRDVLAATEGRQVPWDNSSLTGEVVLKAAPIVEPEPVVEEKPADPDNSVELAYWDTIKAAEDKDYFALYLQQYPDGIFVQLARMKIAMIEKKVTERAAAEAAAKLQAELEAKAKAEADAMAKLEAERLAREAALLAEAARSAQVTAERAAGEEVAALVSPSALGGEAEGEPDTETVRQVQKELNRLGCSAGGADGVWGQGSRRALGQFERHSGVELASLEPSVSVLGTLRARKARVCPLVCGRNEEEKKGRCVEIRREAKLPPAERTTGDERKTEKKKAAGGCPASALQGAKEMASRGRIGFMQRTDFVTGGHTCGKRYACTRTDTSGTNNSWRCVWR
jgi:uncharacterized caspase-like protein